MTFLTRAPLGLLLLASSLLSSGFVLDSAQASTPEFERDRAQDITFQTINLQETDWNLVANPNQGSPVQSRGGASRNGEWSLIPSHGQGSPVQSRGGASRRADLPANLPANLPQDMTTLMPETGYGLTVSSHPTFSFYLPESQAQAGFFRLKNAQGQVVYEQPLEQPHQAGIVAIALPEHLPELTIGETYQWFVVLQSEDKYRPSSPFIDAGIRRVKPSPDIQKALTTMDTHHHIQALTTQNIWYDTLALVSDQRLMQPDSVAAQNQWESLLQSVGLASLADAPIARHTAEN